MPRSRDEDNEDRAVERYLQAQEDEAWERDQMEEQAVKDHLRKPPPEGVA